MKIRNGFVSNSSSTSFCVFGVYIKDPDALCNKLMGEVKETKTAGCSHNIDRDKVKFCPDCGAKAWNIQTTKRYPEEELESYFYTNKDTHKKLGLDSVRWSGGENCGGGIYIGINLQERTFSKSDIKSDIIKNIECKLKEIFPEESPEFYSDHGYS